MDTNEEKKLLWKDEVFQIVGAAMKGSLIRVH